MNFYCYRAYPTFEAEETAETVQVNVVRHNWPEAPHRHHKVKLLPVVEDFLDSRTPMSLLPVLSLFLPPYLFHPLSSSLKLKRLASLQYMNHHRSVPIETQHTETALCFMHKTNVFLNSCLYFLFPCSVQSELSHRAHQNAGKGGRN